MKEVFHGKPCKLIRILGKYYAVYGTCLKARIEVWDLDENGNIQKDKNGNIKVKIITKYINCIDIWAPNDVDLTEVEK